MLIFRMELDLNGIWIYWSVFILKFGFLISEIFQIPLFLQFYKIISVDNYKFKFQPKSQNVPKSDASSIGATRWRIGVQWASLPKRVGTEPWKCHRVKEKEKL